MNTNILDFGAVTDGRICTTYIQAAIDECFMTGGGRVTVPVGTFVTGTLRLKSNVELHLEYNAKLLASENYLDYNSLDEYEQNFFSEKEGWSGRHLVICVEQENVAITGKGTIDGNAKSFFCEPKDGTSAYHWRFGVANTNNSEQLRPGQMLCFIESKNICVEDVKLNYSSCWTLFVHGCEDVILKNVRIKNDPWNLNTDGIDIDTCKNVLVEGCIIDSGDDPLTIRCSAKRLKYAKPVCENIIMTNCIVSTEANAVRIGVGEGLIKNVNISNIIAKRAGDGIHFACDYLNVGRVNMENISFSNILVDNCSIPISIINANGAKLKNISFDNCNFKTLRGMVTKYSSKVSAENMRFTNCRFEIAEGFDIFPKINSLSKEDMGECVLDFKNINGLTLDRVRVDIHEKHKWLQKLNIENCNETEFCCLN